jgi:hypothetical protein
VICIQNKCKGETAGNWLLLLFLEELETAQKETSEK